MQSATCMNNNQFCASWPNWAESHTSPHCCPVCNGTGHVCRGFYDPYYDRMYQTASTPEVVTCRSCNGTGVLWQ